MRHFPIYLDLHNASVVVSGAGDTAVAKLRLLLKTDATLTVFGTDAVATIRGWSDAGKLVLVERRLSAGDADGARLVYAANDDPAEDARVAALGRAAGALVNVVDNLEASAFITPAIVDRDPVTIAIGTEGAAPVLARRIKADLESTLDSNLGVLARIGRAFRGEAAALPRGGAMRRFWAEYYEDIGPRAHGEGGEAAVTAALTELLSRHLAASHTDTDAVTAATGPGHVDFIGAGPGDPDLLTNQARRALHDADIIIHDRLVSGEILELARREAHFIEVGKTPGGESWLQDDINRLMVEHAGRGQHVARLKSGDPTVYGRLDEEMDALDGAGIGFAILPGITSALAAAARARVSLTRRQRNSEFRLLTGQDINGYTEQDWHGLARSGAVAAIYMGVRAVRFLQGRLMMHGADPLTPVTIVENISRRNERMVVTTLGGLDAATRDSGLKGPAVILYGLERRVASRSQNVDIAAPAAQLLGAH